MTEPQLRTQERRTRFDQALLGGWVVAISLASGGCHSLLTPHQAPYQRNDCDSIGGCGGYTETQWTSLEGCGWEDGVPVTPLPMEEQDFYGQSISINEAVAQTNHIEQRKFTERRQPTEQRQLTERRQLIERRNHAVPGSQITQRNQDAIDDPSLARENIESSSYLPLEESAEKDPSLNQEVLQYAESVELKPAPSDLKIREARHEKQLDEISIEYLQ